MNFSKSVRCDDIKETHSAVGLKTIKTTLKMTDKFDEILLGNIYYFTVKIFAEIN